MSVKIRMKRMGSKKRPFYRLVAADSRYPRDGRFLEILGYYNPMVEPAEIQLDEDKVYKWLDDGAKPTPNAANVLRTAGLLERWRLLRSGVTVPQLDAKIEELRAKQPKAQERTREKLSKKAIAAAKKAQEEKAAAEEAGAQAAGPAEPAGSAEEAGAAEDAAPGGETSNE